ncbi:Ig-like domain-containing protein [Streptomyces sp. NPDC059740]|uniref:L,D-transpeptidase n=1 Tax=Streptomyces sp. NPDC059740 TaxID=3346926 RepID=UPI00364DDE24
MSHRPRSATVLSCALLMAPLAVASAACSGSMAGDPSARPYDATNQISANLGGKGRDADPDKPLEISVKDDDARITDVTATDASGRQLQGRLSEDGRKWRTTAPLAAGAHYSVHVSTENEDGDPGRKVFDVRTRDADSSRLKVTFGPESGTYGVGQPITATLDRPVKERSARAVVERALRVDTVPGVEGSWYWVDDKTLHYRPREYWPAHATIRVHSNLQGLKVSKGLYGGEAKALKLQTGDAIEAVTDAGAHNLKLIRNGEVVKTLPVTTGKPGYATRNGVKVILGKEAFVRMRSSTVGIAAGSADSYDLPVHWATRVTRSGEYVHAAPWSVGSQGFANTSHGCTGMSTENAKWFFDQVHIGDIVKVVGSEGDTMTPFDNGYGDWNLSWAKWQEGSALSGKKPAKPQPKNQHEDERLEKADSGAARLRPQV